jgi:AraC-like DNA-binding protein/mannose-6-phosphate isomerase-like protein (cupin superfamily)
MQQKKPQEIMGPRSKHYDRLWAIETAAGPVHTSPNHYSAGDLVERHSHKRTQLLYARSGVVLVTTDQGRWMVPPEHALWIPPGVEHSVEMLGAVTMLSLYLDASAVPDLPGFVRVVSITGLARELIIEAVQPPSDDNSRERADLILPLLLNVVAKLPDISLGLPFPTDPRLAALCRRFIANPTPDLIIDAWAKELSMSRRAFTRAFRRETGLSLSVWRQQACLFAALPRLAAGEPVTSIALDLGYGSIPAFTTMFKRMLGASPRSYRNSHSGQ